MFRFALLMLLSTSVYATESVDIETAATVYQDAATREQVRASLASMPAHIRQLFTSDKTAKLSDHELELVTAAAKRGFRIDVFEAPALTALAANLDSITAKKTEEFLVSDLGRRMVAADKATAVLEESKIDKIMNGDLPVPSTPQRNAILDKLGHALKATESTVQIFLNMGEAVAIGTAVGSGKDVAAAESTRKSVEASRLGLEQSMREPLQRYLAYSYRDLSDADLKHVLKFLESPPGKRYVSASIASLGAGYDAMGRRCGEQLGESLRELAQAQSDTPTADTQPADATPQR